jgi:Fe-S-cluster containining protein
MNPDNKLAGEKLCKKCRLCCEGVFHEFADLETDDDFRIAKKANIPIELYKATNKYVFTLPCPAFNGLCSIYPERPSVCSGHMCDLLKSVICGNMAIEDALNLVKKMQDVFNHILQELRGLDKNNASNNPAWLMGAVLENLGDESSVDKFKKEHTALLIQYGVFNFLTHKYFYKSYKIFRKF